MLPGLSFGSGLFDGVVNSAEGRNELTWQTCIDISRCFPKQVHRKGFIAMESPIVRADDLPMRENRSRLWL